MRLISFLLAIGGCGRTGPSTKVCCRGQSPRMRVKRVRWGLRISTEPTFIAKSKWSWLKLIPLSWNNFVSLKQFCFNYFSGPHAGPLLISPTILDTFPIIQLVITIMSKNFFFRAWHRLKQIYFNHDQMLYMQWKSKDWKWLKQIHYNPEQKLLIESNYKDWNW